MDRRRVPGQGIAAGDLCVLGADGRISGSSGGTGLSGSTTCAGVAVRTAASGEKVGVIRWGFVKNLTAGNAIGQGHMVQMLGGNFVGTIGPPGTSTAALTITTIGQAVFGPSLATSAASGSEVNVFLNTL